MGDRDQALSLPPCPTCPPLPTCPSVSCHSSSDGHCLWGQRLMTRGPWRPLDGSGSPSMMCSEVTAAREDGRGQIGRSELRGWEVPWKVVSCPFCRCADGQRWWRARAMACSSCIPLSLSSAFLGCIASSLPWGDGLTLPRQRGRSVSGWVPALRPMGNMPLRVSGHQQRPQCQRSVGHGFWM